MKVFITTDSPSYAKWIDNAEIVDKINDANIVIFTGGEDIDPGLYGESRHHSFTFFNRHRDNIDEFFYRKAKDQNKFLIGICRGSQFITAMAGGRVLQHVNNHNRNEDGHEILVDNKDIFHITSTHHQMMYPYTAKQYEIIGISSPPLSDVYFRNDINIYDMVEEPEIVWYPEIRGLAIQGHPEMMPKQEPVIKYLNKLILNKLTDDLPFK